MQKPLSRLPKRHCQQSSVFLSLSTLFGVLEGCKLIRTWLKTEEIDTMLLPYFKLFTDFSSDLK